MAFAFTGTVYVRFGTYTTAYIMLIGVCLLGTVLHIMIRTFYDTERNELLDRNAGDKQVDKAN